MGLSLSEIIEARFSKLVFKRAVGRQSLTVLGLVILGIDLMRARNWMEMRCLRM